MAELVESNETNQATKAGRHSRFTATEDLIIVREVAASEAHTAAFGEVCKKCEDAAVEVNKNPSMVQKVTWKTVQDRYERLQDQYNKPDNDDQKLSAVGGGEMGELGELLMMMREARDDMETKKGAEKAEQRKKEADKERFGEVIVAASTKRKSQRSEEDDDDGDWLDISENGHGSATKKKRQRRDLANDISGEMERFGSHLKDADIARVSLESERLEFERMKDTMDFSERKEEREERGEEREAERKERCEEREKQMELEIEKLKLMMEAVSRN